SSLVSWFWRIGGLVDADEGRDGGAGAPRWHDGALDAGAAAYGDEEVLGATWAAGGQCLLQGGPGDAGILHAVGRCGRHHGGHGGWALDSGRHQLVFPG